MQTGIILILFGILGIFQGMHQESLGGNQDANEEAMEHVHGHDSVEEDGQAADHVQDQEQGQDCQQNEGSAEAQLKLRMRLRLKRSMNC